MLKYLHCFCCRKIIFCRHTRTLGGNRMKKTALELMGFKKSARGTRFVGWIAKMICRIVENSISFGEYHYNQKVIASKKLHKMLDKIDRYRVIGEKNLKGTNGMGIVLGFNHPSLGELPRIVRMCNQIFQNPFREILFPVKLSWYESLFPLLDELKCLFSITLTPVITPKLKESMIKERPEISDTVERMAKRYNSLYLEKSVEVLRHGGVVIVAPSATRKERIFNTFAEPRGEETIEPQTMSLLATAVSKDIFIKCVFIPLTVVPTKNCNKGLNPWKNYTLNIGIPFSKREAIELSKIKLERCNGRQLDYQFAWHMADILLIYGHLNMVFPPETDTEQEE